MHICYSNIRHLFKHHHQCHHYGLFRTYICHGSTCLANTISTLLIQVILHTPYYCSSLHLGHRWLLQATLKEQLSVSPFSIPITALLSLLEKFTVSTYTSLCLNKIAIISTIVWDSLLVFHSTISSYLYLYHIHPSSGTIVSHLGCWGACDR